jgi:ribosomal protein S18 acetylase RimI-like enzyme
MPTTTTNPPTTSASNPSPKAEKPAVSIRPAFFPQDHSTVSTLFTAYAASLQIDLSFQSFEHELASLPGKYDEQNGGALFLASIPTSAANNTTISASFPSSLAKTVKEGDPVNPTENAVHIEEKVIGCAAVRSLPLPNLSSSPSFQHRICELKRLYTLPTHRNLGAGRLLMATIIHQAQSMGYTEMLLDTLPTMLDAIKMYKAFGFEVVDKYYESPIEGTCFMRLRL